MARLAPAVPDQSPTALPAPSWSPLAAACRTTRISVGLVAAAATAGALASAAAAEAGPALLVTAGLLGLPHGAVDHLALGWVRGRTGPAQPSVLFAYAAAALVAAVAALAAPLPALLLLLALSVAHFAEGEAAFDRLRGGAGLRLPAAALGTAVVALPLVLRPAAARTMLIALDPALPVVLAGARLPLLVGTALLVTVGLVVALRGGQRTAATELAVVAVAAALGPPLVVFAAWFAGWHAPRHLVRLAALEPSGDGRERVRRLARGAALPTAFAAAGLAGLALLLGGLPAAVLIVLLALTVPHAAVVAQLDRLVTTTTVDSSAA